MAYGDDANLIDNDVTPILSILSRTNPIPRIDTYFFKIHSNIVLPSTPDDDVTVGTNIYLLLNACKSTGLTVNKYREIKSNGGIMTNEPVTVGSMKKVKTFKYLCSLLIDKNSIEKEIKM